MAKRRTESGVQNSAEVESVTVSKGMTIPAEVYGGDKFEMIRVDASVTVKKSPFITTDDLYKQAWKLVDDQVSDQINSEIKSLNGRKK